MRIDKEEAWFGIANGYISSIFDRVICLRHDNGEGIIISHFYLHCSENRHKINTGHYGTLFYYSTSKKNNIKFGGLHFHKDFAIKQMRYTSKFRVFRVFFFFFFPNR